MKLFGWMHRKLRPSEPLKEFSIGQSSLAAPQYYPKSNYGTKSFGKAQRENHLRHSFASLEAAKVEEDESSTAISELFHGFLTIGTLGSDPVFTDPSTPTFGISIENITEKDTEVTENDLKLINDELEKVLGAEGKEDGCNDSSGRNSYVSTGRSSHGSTITLNGKPLEATETIGNGTTICPLQGYLFGSGIEFPKTTVVKKEHRTSLGELFQRTKLVEESSVAKCGRGEKQIDKETDKSAINLMKKMLKKRMFHASSRASTTVTGGSVDSASTEKKLHKVSLLLVLNISASTETQLHKFLQMFHRKVYPESSTVGRKFDRPQKNEIKNVNYERGYNNADYMLPDEDITIFPQRPLSKESIKCLKSHSNAPQVTMRGSDSNRNREYWIKTDADYLVLEL